MAKNKAINVMGTEITIFQGEQTDYISLTDIAKHKDASNTDTIIQNWLRNRNTIELLGFWEIMYNIHFKPLEFEGFRKKLNFVYANEADLLNVALFGTTAKQWRDANPNSEGNIRDDASIEQLVVLSNLESINAVLIHQGVSQPDRLIQLNKIAITQMKSLLNSSSLKKLK